MHAYVINIMVVLIIFPVILQTDIDVIMLSIGGQGDRNERDREVWPTAHITAVFAFTADSWPEKNKDEPQPYSPRAVKESRSPRYKKNLTFRLGFCRLHGFPVMQSLASKQKWVNDYIYE